MSELLPVVTCAVLGAVIWRRSRGPSLLMHSVAAVLASGIVATALSGEYRASWIYLLVDLAEAAFGLALGYAIAHRTLPRSLDARTGAAALFSTEAERTPPPAG